MQDKWKVDDSENTSVTVGEPGDEINQEYTYLTDQHYKDTFLTGKYYKTQVCVQGDENCGAYMQVFVVDNAMPAMDIPYQGVIGFGLYKSLGGEQSTNVLTQLVENDWIDQTSFGVFTGTDSSVESSQISLGQPNKALWASGWNEPVWFESTGSKEWTVEVQ